jgi:NDP-sugar pyrophosphorylase family protein
MHNAADPIILCGGAGLRLKSVTGDAPKSLACIGKRPFLEILLGQLRRHGFDRVILAVGYQKQLIRSHFGDRTHGIEIRYSIESTALGTGGAVRNAMDLMETDTALILNGDSYTDADLRSFLTDYRVAGSDVSVLVVHTDDRTDCGLVAVDSAKKVLAFREKQSTSGKQYINAGIYLASKQILNKIPAGIQVSLEAELFPRWLREGRHIIAFHHLGECIDIGTPERYRSAQLTLANAEAVDSPILPDCQSV